MVFKSTLFSSQAKLEAAVVKPFQKSTIRYSHCFGAAFPIRVSSHEEISLGPVLTGAAACSAKFCHVNNTVSGKICLTNLVRFILETKVY